MLSIWITGVEVLVVDFRGKARLRPQSPLPSEDCVVSIAACVGYGVVAVSESRVEIAEKSGLGRGRGGGREKSLDVLNRLAVGDSLCRDIVYNGRDRQIGRRHRKSTLLLTFTLTCIAAREIVPPLPRANLAMFMFGPTRGI